LIKIKKHLSLQPLISGFKTAFDDYVDPRRENSVSYTVLDTALSGLACMFYKSSSMLNFQTRMEKAEFKNNLQTQFGVIDTPKDNQMREIISDIPTDKFKGVFNDYQAKLQRNKQLDKFRFNSKYLVAIDATQFYTSEDINCQCCLTQKKRNGKIEYSHKALQPIICHPDQKQILPLMPEEIRNSDGTAKQDCEINAAKRLLPKLRQQHPRMPFIWLADSIYATAPFIQGIMDHDESYIFRIKKGDHKHLYEHLETTEYQSHKTTDGKSTISYRWYYDTPLNNSTDIKVTVIQAFSIKKDKNGKQVPNIIGLWATNLEVDRKTVKDITKAARARWKIENECFNHLKNSGYNLAHNWGHVKGEAFHFYILIMLAFYIHQILELTDELFLWCRRIGRTFKQLWGDLEFLFRIFLFDSWEHMLCFYIEKNKEIPPQIV